jgi:HD domain
LVTAGEAEQLKIPSKRESEALIKEAGALNPGPWMTHSFHVAEAASLIASCHPQMDAGAAYVVGLLHDIGRRVGVTGMRHALDGYHYLLSLGYDDAARISLTHSYPIKDIDAGADLWDGSEEEAQFLQSYLNQIEYDLYDRLIQLCDSLALPSGFCLMEKRLVDVVMRYGTNPLTIPKWKAYFAIRDDFEREIGGSIYALLPGVVENTFPSSTQTLKS